MRQILIKILTGIIFGSVFFACLIFLPTIYFSVTLGVIALLCVFEFIRLFPFNKFWLCLILPIYPIFSFVLMILMNQSGKKAELFILFLSIFAFDTGAYFIGKSFGKHNISKISPNKTWEGFFGGLITTFLIILILYYISSDFNFSLINLFQNCYNLLLVILISIIAQLGDLFESWFKRKAQIKDSGILLPGHGGFLDRFDAVIFVTPIVYLFFY